MLVARMRSWQMQCVAGASIRKRRALQGTFTRRLSIPLARRHVICVSPAAVSYKIGRIGVALPGTPSSLPRDAILSSCHRAIDLFLHPWTSQCSAPQLSSLHAALTRISVDRVVSSAEVQLRSTAALGHILSKQHRTIPLHAFSVPRERLRCQSSRQARRVAMP